MSFIRVTMTHDSITSHRILKISELTRVIASQLTSLSRRSAVNLACVCRYLEEPVLSTLWEEQRTLYTLLKVLPEETWHFERYDRTFTIVGDPSPENWKRVRRYASWMHHVLVDESLTLTGDASHEFRQNSPAGGWFPALQGLSWCITASNLPYADLFFSPHLKRIFISSSSPWRNYGVPRDILPAIASRIAALPTSALQYLRVGISWHYWMPWAYFKDSLSHLVLRCGSSLTEFASPIPLSDAAINHLIHLPHLHTWHVECPPPNYSTSSLPPVFPPLTELALGEGAACGWLSLFRRLEAGVPVTQGVTTLSKAKESLQFLDVESTLSPIIDVEFTSPIQIFHNLVSLSVEAHCHGKDGRGQCAFKLNDDDIAELAVALPQLEFLLLGHPCSENACPTTTACLLSISVYCPKLEVLEIHFNTTNIVGDLKNILADPKFEALRSLPRGTLPHLNVYRTPLALNELGFETVAKGMVGIFPSLQHCGGIKGAWGGVNGRIEELRKMVKREKCPTLAPPSLDGFARPSEPTG